MSDASMGRPQGPTRGTPPTAGGMNPMHGADRAYMQSRGQMSPDMSIADFIKAKYNLPVTAPVSSLQQVVATQAAGATPSGKRQELAGRAGGMGTGVMPPAQPPMGAGRQMGQPAQQRPVRTSAQPSQGQTGNRLGALLSAAQQ